MRLHSQFCVYFVLLGTKQFGNHWKIGGPFVRISDKWTQDPLEGRSGSPDSRLRPLYFCGMTSRGCSLSNFYILMHLVCIWAHESSSLVDKLTLPSLKTRLASRPVIRVIQYLHSDMRHLQKTHLTWCSTSSSSLLLRRCDPSTTTATSYLRILLTITSDACLHSYLKGIFLGPGSWLCVNAAG